MKKNIELNEQELETLVQQFYEYFETGYRFEKFLKIYLERIGLDEVFVTQRSRDGGIDLTAIRKGLGEFTQAVDDNYYIQAKLYQPNNIIPPQRIRELRGAFLTGTGILITTARVSDMARQDALSFDQQRSIIVIDGKELVRSCIDNELGFAYKPVFSRVALDLLMPTDTDEAAEDEIYIEKQITRNDVRARILPLPKEIKNRIPDNMLSLVVSFNGDSSKKYNIDANRRYLGGITRIYRKHGLLQQDNEVIPKKAKWSIDNQFLVKIIIED